jgi:hypothetical protein
MYAPTLGLRPFERGTPDFHVSVTNLMGRRERVRRGGRLPDPDGSPPGGR